ncbi:MAG TPA: EAL domain-containing protein [Nocardioidaceae bacterium]|nr:EAL domain-containing protein [Nocardioidaceae bacterium]
MESVHTPCKGASAFRGKDQSVYYEQTLGRSRVRRLALLESLRVAINARQLRLAYQPVVHLETGQIVGVEALARWAPGGVTVRPDVFIGVAEESGLIVPLGNLVLDLAGADAEHLEEAAGRPLTIGVNVSAQQLRLPSFSTKVESILAQMAGTNLVLEITERDFVNYDPALLESMEHLAAQDVRFALDDFGIGYSSIGYLQRMPIRIIKADASFSAGIDTDERACGLLRSIRTMGLALDIDVVVEGLERPSQVEHVREHVGATLGQGFLLHRPMPLTDVMEVLRRNRVAFSPTNSPRPREAG